MSKTYYEQHKEECKKRNDEWKKNNPEKLKQYKKKHYQKNKKNKLKEVEILKEQIDNILSGLSYENGKK